MNPHPLLRSTGRTSRTLVAGIGLLLGFVVCAVTVGRVESVGLTRMEPSRPVRSLALRVEDIGDGSITLRDADNGNLVATVLPGADNFIRATLRGFGQARLRAGLSREEPFRLTRFDDGSLRLDDALTGRSVDFGAFGPSNFAAFARLMPDQKPCPIALPSGTTSGSCVSALSDAEPAHAQSAGGAAR